MTPKVAALCQDQCGRWGRGDRKLIEAYLADDPALEKDAEALLDLLLNEVLLREKSGGAPAVEEYQRRFPHHAKAVGDLLALHRALDEALPPSVPPAESPEPTPSHAPTLKQLAAVQPVQPGSPSVERVDFPTIPGYTFERELGRGGMGIVYLATDLGTGRRVALKTIGSGRLASREEVDRFRREVESAARLEHRHIVRLYAAGEHAGLHYFTMEYIEGDSLAARMSSLSKEPKAIAALLITMARAVHFAHEREVLHRDLKPGNILLDRDGEPHVCDFGLAKRLAGKEQATLSSPGIGTPAYMAPEQLREEKFLGRTTDVYALGAILYEVLAGEPPFKAGTNLETMNLRLQHEAPASPCRRNPQANQDLAMISLECLHREPTRRYPSAADLADDLQRFQDGKPLHVRPAGLLERAGRWVWRHKAVTALVGFICLTAAAVALAGIVTWLWQGAATARDEATAARQQAETERDLKDQANEALDRVLYAHRVQTAGQEWYAGDDERAARLLESCPPERRHWEWYYLRRLCPRLLVLRAGHIASISHVIFSHDGARVATASVEGTVKVWEVATGKEVVTMPAQPGEGKLVDVAFTLEGRITTLVEVAQSTNASRGVESYAVYVKDLGNGRAVSRTITELGMQKLWGKPALITDGTRFVGVAEGTVRLWDVASGRELRRLGPELSADRTRGKTAVFLSSSNKVLSYRIGNGSPRVADLDSGKEVWKPPSDVKLQDLLIGRNEERLLGMEYDRRSSKEHLGLEGDWRMRVWDRRAGKTVFDVRKTFPRVDRTQGVITAISDDGNRVAGSLPDGKLRVFDVGSQQERYVTGVPGGNPDALTIALGPDGRDLAVARRFEGMLELWHLLDVEPILTPDQPLRLVPDRYPIPDADLIPVRDEKGGILYPPYRDVYYRVAFLGEGRLVSVSTLTAAWNQGNPRLPERSGAAVTVWNLATGKKEGGHPDLPYHDRFCLATGPRQKAVVIVGRDTELYEVDFSRPDCPVAVVASRGRSSSSKELYGGAVALSKDGKRMAVVIGLREVEVHEQGGAKSSFKIGEVEDVYAESLSFSPDGQRLAVGTNRGAWVRNLSTGEWERTFQHSTVPLGALTVAFGPSGKQLATAGAGTITLWDVETGREVTRFREHRGTDCLAFSPDGRRLAGGDGREIRLWDTGSGEEVLRLRVDKGECEDLAFSPDGSRLAAACGRGGIQVWSAPFPPKRS
jgi:WD40 repeat protein